MSYDKKIFEYQYPIVTDFVRHLAYYRGLKSEKDRQEINSMFWAQTINAHLKSASICWCKVFGSEGPNDTHWKKTPTEDIVKAKARLSEKISVKLDASKDTLKLYHKEMCAFRDKFVAHCDLDNTPNVPQFDTALQIAYAYDAWVRDLIKPDFIDDSTLKRLYIRWVKVGISIGRSSLPNNESALNI